MTASPTAAELKQLAKENDLPATGTKAQLEERLKDAGVDPVPAGQPVVAKQLLDTNTSEELKAKAAESGSSTEGTRAEIADGIIDARDPHDVGHDDQVAADAAKGDPSPADGAPRPATPSEVSKPATPEGLKAPKVKKEKDGSLAVTVKRDMTYIELVEEIGYVGGHRDLMAFNGRRNGRTELSKGDLVLVPPAYVPAGS